MPTKDKKKIVFICYGGGHVELIKALLPSLTKSQLFDIFLIPLTVATKAIPAEGIDGVTILKISEFLPLFDDVIDDVFKQGLAILSDNYNPNIGVEKLDTIFYLGLSMYDAVKQHGHNEALKRYEKNGRQSFLPVESLKKILQFLNPDLVFTTNSPRFEQAALIAAKQLNVASMQILDLFGDGYPEPSADYVLVLNQSVVNKLKERGVPSRFFAIGQPIFDHTVETVSKLPRLDLLKKLDIDPGFKTILFCPTLYYVWNDDLTIKEIRDLALINKPMFEILDDLIARFNINVIIRPHPVSDSIDNYLFYTAGKKNYYYFDNTTLDILESIAVSDICLTYNSTVAVQAIICNKSVVTYNYAPEEKYYWPEMTTTPFKYASNYKILSHILTEEVQRTSANQKENDFYKIGAADKILKILKEEIWNS